MSKRSTAARILIADDQQDVIQALRLLLKGEGFETAAVTSPAAVLGAIESQEFDAVLLDLNYTRDTTSGREGLDLLAKIQTLDSTLPVIVMTAWASVETAVEAMRRGARDYIEKPWDNTRLVTHLRTQIELGRALRKSQRLEDVNRRLSSQDLPELIAESRVMEPVMEMMERVAPSDANVLISGEHGTGKDVVARWIHAVSDRASRPLVPLDAGSIAETLFESELFGHVKGAFTDAKADRVGCFELANNGTLFLDEIANVPLKQQAKLLRVLETGELQRVGSSKVRQVNVRVLSATNAKINEAVAAGEFREDLLYRLNTIEIHLPPLRERREDISALASHFLQPQADRYRKKIEGFDPEAMKAMLKHSWPGNVRELEHVVERSVLMAKDTLIRVDDLGLRRRPEAAARLDEMTLDEIECYMIKKTLNRCGDNVSQAAAALGLSRSALYRRLERYGL